MFFNLINISITFQVYINKTLSDLLDVCYIIYLDDILIYFNFKKQHHYHIHKVLECLHKYRLYIKINKCFFEINIINFLSFIMSLHDIQIKKSQIKIILK